MAFEQSVPAEEDCNEFGLDVTKPETQGSLFRVAGYVSKPDHGMGRSTADRQFLYINKRPCELVKVSRVINEVYHMYNRHQYPFVMLDISLARGELRDVKGDSHVVMPNMGTIATRKQLQDLKL